MMADPLSLSPLLLLACFMPLVGASSTQANEADYYYALSITGFAFIIIFAVFAFGQLAFSTSKRYIRSRALKAAARMEAKARVDDRHFPFYILMVITLSMFIARYSLLAASYSVIFPVLVAGIVMPLVNDLADELLFATLFAMLILFVSETWDTDDDPATVPWTKDAVLIAGISLVSLMGVVTIARAIIIGVAYGMGSFPLDLTAFILYHLHFLLFLILTVLFVIKSFSMRKMRKKLMIARAGLLTVNGIFDYQPSEGLERMVKFVSPLLCSLTVYTIITDILGVFINSGIFDVQHTAIYILAALIIRGVIYFLLLCAMLTAGSAL